MSEQHTQSECRTCARIGCGNPATHMPGFIIHHKSAPKAGMQIVLGIVICAEHARTATVADFMTDQGWERICQGVEAIGKRRPTRRLTEIFVQPIQEAPGFFANRAKGGAQ